jgi:hypothetical protein
MLRDGTYKITGDFRVESYGHTSVVRDINFTPSDRSLPDVGICRIFTTREDAVIILNALEVAND